MNIIGHQNVQTSLNELLLSGRMPHAMLFHGSKGVGKRLVAEVFARRLLCGAGAPEESWQLSFNTKHPVYPQVEAMSSPDFHIIEPDDGKKSISVDQVRSTLSKLSLSSDGDRVVIIDAAEQMGAAAANALLKTLEEPGQGIHLILICHNLSKLLPTIVSRCRQFRFSPLSENEVKFVLEENFPEKGRQEVDELAMLAAGCPGEAERLMGDAQEILHALDAFFKKLPAKSTLPALELSDKLHRKKLAPLGMEMLLKKVALFARDKNILGVTPREWAELYASLCEKNIDMQTLNLNAQLVLESALLDVQKAVSA